MKTFTQIQEHCVTSDVNPGNSLELGVTNHLTPVNNIVTNVRNLFAPQLGLVVAVAEDGVSIKLHSHAFTSKEEVDKVLNAPVQHTLSVGAYIQSQGLDKIKLVNLGHFIVVYFSPSDIKTANPGLEANPASEPTKEAFNSDSDSEIIYESGDSDDEIKDITNKKIREIIDSEDKAKGAKQLELLVTQEIELPREYYFAGMSPKQGTSGSDYIALRWRFIKRKAHKKSEEISHTLIEIYDLKEDGIWVPDFDKKGYFKLPDEVKTLIEHVLELLGAEKTSDPAIWSLKEKSKEKDDEDSDKDKDKDSDSKDSSKDKDDSKEEDTKKEKKESDDDEGSDDSDDNLL